MPERLNYHDDYLSRAADISIHVGLLILFCIVCCLILRPFFAAIAWGAIIAIAIYPKFHLLQVRMHISSTLAAVICTIVLLAILIVPIVLLTDSLVDGVQSLTARVKEGTLLIPPPPPRLESLPIVGAPLKHIWDLASKNIASALQAFAPQIKEAIHKLLAASAEIGFAALQAVLSILVTGVLLAKATSATNVSHPIANRLFGARGEEFEQLAVSTIRSITVGVLGVALIQSAFAVLGFLAVGLPGTGLWSLVFLTGALFQCGGLVLIPAVVYIFATASTTKAVIFLIWCLIVGVMDNVLKPLLLGRGSTVPMVIIFLGAIGGFLAMGALGLFLGAIFLSVGFKLFVVWVQRSNHSARNFMEQDIPA